MSGTRFVRTELVAIPVGRPARTERSRRWPLGSLDAVLVLAALALTAWNALGARSDVAAVAFGQTTRWVVGVRATTSQFGGVTADHQGTSAILLGCTAAARITPSATNAGSEFCLASSAPASNGYRVRFESTVAGDDIPAGMLSAVWTVGETVRSASVPVDARDVTALNRGGFTVTLPGTLTEGPKNICVVYQGA